MSGVITSYFGARENVGNGAFHKGIDIGANKNTPVYAVKDGKILEVATSGSYGIYVKYKTNDNYIITYAHLNRAFVQKGENIKQGQKLALVGDTGQATGYHLHYEVQKGDRHIDPINMVSLPYASYLK